MKILGSILMFLAVLSWTAEAQASCYTTVSMGNPVVICTVCCSGGICTTSCT